MPVLPARGTDPALQFELLRDSMLQTDGLVLTEAVDPAFLEHACRIHRCDFGDDPACIYTPGVVLWAVVSQALSYGTGRSLQAAVDRIAKLHSQRNRPAIGLGTGAYAAGRVKLGHAVIRAISNHLADAAESAFDLPAPPPQARDAATIDLVRGVEAAGRIFMIDGFTVTMADTPANQKAWPQSTRQKEGLGFPIMRCVAMISMTTGLVHDLAMGPYAGKQTGETALFREMLDRLRPGDVVVADSYHCTWWMLEACQKRGVIVAAKNHHSREDHPGECLHIDTTQRVVTWIRPDRPSWMTREQYLKKARQLKVRLADVGPSGVDRGSGFTIATTQLDAEAAPAWWIGALYRGRWWVELDIRAIKASMELDHMRAKSPAMVKLELWSVVLGYNLVRLRMLQASAAAASAERSAAAVAAEGGAGREATVVKAVRSPRTMSFSQARVSLSEGWLLYAVSPATEASRRQADAAMLHRRVGHRPGREEPRAVKRRRTPIALLMEPRQRFHARSRTAA